jgi:hypothetical protein
MNLQRFQLDVAARLETANAFANIPVFIFRPRAALTAAQIQDNINSALGALTNQNGKAGLCAMVLMPLIHTENQELPGPYPHVKCIIRVQENVTVNMGANGTLIACEDAAIEVAQILHLWTPGGTAGILRVSPETITPNLTFEGRVTYDVLVESELDLPCLEKTEQPFVSVSEGQVTIECSDGMAAIYYTTDGSMPWAGNGTYPGTATAYAGPFASPPAGTLIRAAAYNPAKVGSDVDFLQL